MATQVKTGLPSGEFFVVDNSAAPGFPTLDITKENIGYDDTAPGAGSQSTNPFGDTGSVLIDASGNDQARNQPACATFPGNPVSLNAPTFTTVTKVLTNPLSATILFKNPA